MRETCIVSRPCLFSGSVNSSDVCQVFRSLTTVLSTNIQIVVFCIIILCVSFSYFQGRLGDCWFLSAVAVLTEMSRISEVIITPEFNEEGIYTVRFCIQVITS